MQLRKELAVRKTAHELRQQADAFWLRSFQVHDDSTRLIHSCKGSCKWSECFGSTLNLCPSDALQSSGRIEKLVHIDRKAHLKFLPSF